MQPAAWILGYQGSQQHQGNQPTKEKKEYHTCDGIKMKCTVGDFLSFSVRQNGADVKWVDGGKAIFKLSTHVVSTVYTQVKPLPGLQSLSLSLFLLAH